MTTVNLKEINPAFTNSPTPQCFYYGEKDSYILNESAYHQIQRVSDLLAAMAAFSDGQDKRTEQLFNTMAFAADLLDQATSWNCI